MACAPGGGATSSSPASEEDDPGVPVCGPPIAEPTAWNSAGPARAPTVAAASSAKAAMQLQASTSQPYRRDGGGAAATHR
jgi:hypothetical protein